MSTTMERVAQQKAPLAAPSDIDAKAVKDITGALNALLADVLRRIPSTANGLDQQNTRIHAPPLNIDVIALVG